MTPYTLGRREKTPTGDVPREARKMIAKKKVRDRRDRRKADRKALRDEWGF
jgi:hypothetical protein